VVVEVAALQRRLGMMIELAAAAWQQHGGGSSSAAVALCNNELKISEWRSPRISLTLVAI
jgi:hypothetical protein